MIGIILYVLGSLGGGLLAYVLVAVLRKPMVFVLREICGGPERAEFWRRLIVVELTSVATLLSMLGAQPDHFASTSQASEQVWLVLKQIRWGLLGCVTSLPLVGIGILLLIPGYERRKNDDREGSTD